MESRILYETNQLNELEKSLRYSRVWFELHQDVKNVATKSRSTHSPRQCQHTPASLSYSLVTVPSCRDRKVMRQLVKKCNAKRDTHGGTIA